jgi:hypothetical protein
MADGYTRIMVAAAQKFLYEVEELERGRTNAAKAKIVEMADARLWKRTPPMWRHISPALRTKIEAMAEARFKELCGLWEPRRHRFPDEIAAQ